MQLYIHVRVRIPSRREANTGNQSLNKSHIGHSYHLDTEGVIETQFGERRSMVSFSHAGQQVGLVITTTRPAAENELHVVEVRELIDGGMAHTQVLGELAVVFNFSSALPL